MSLLLCMDNKRTRQEIAAEIERLEALKPVGKWAAKTQASINAAIEELKYGHDRTAEEWDEMDSSAQDVADTAERWKEGAADERPSEGWGELVE